MRKLSSSVSLRLFGLAVFALTLLSSLGAADPWLI
jgi:hypothetical protein